MGPAIEVRSPRWWYGSKQEKEFRNLRPDFPPVPGRSGGRGTAGWACFPNRVVWLRRLGKIWSRSASPTASAVPRPPSLASWLPITPGSAHCRSHRLYGWFVGVSLGPLPGTTMPSNTSLRFQRLPLSGSLVPQPRTSVFGGCGGPRIDGVGLLTHFISSRMELGSDENL